MLLAHFDSGVVYDDGDGYLHIFCSGRVSVVLFGFAGHSRLCYVVIIIFVYSGFSVLYLKRVSIKR